MVCGTHIFWHIPFIRKCGAGTHMRGWRFSTYYRNQQLCRVHVLSALTCSTRAGAQRALRCGSPGAAHRCRGAPRPRCCRGSRRGAGCWTGGWPCSGTSPWCAHPLQPWSQVLEKCTRSNYGIFLSNGHTEFMAFGDWLLFPLHEGCPWASVATDQVPGTWPESHNCPAATNCSSLGGPETFRTVPFLWKAIDRH